MPTTPERIALSPTSSLDDWDEVAPLLRKAMAYGHGEYLEKDIFDAIASGQMQLWFFPGAFVITQIEDYPRLRICRVLYAGGDLKVIKDHVGDLEDWSRSMGCRAIDIPHARKGWSRALGWDETAVVVRKEL